MTATGEIVASSQQPTPTERTSHGQIYYAPEVFWQTAVTVMERAWEQAGVKISALGIASMAETGLLVDSRTGQPQSNVLPWYDTSAQQEMNRWSREFDPRERFLVTGLRPSPKYGLAKLLWLKAQGVDFTGKVWLSAADYIAMRLTGRMATEPTLAARTFAYSLRHKNWDQALLSQLGLPEELFPEVVASGAPIGYCRGEEPLTGLAGVPVGICGHDHVVATIALGMLTSGRVLNSMGTAEVLLGVEEEVELDDAAYDSGLSFGPHVLPGLMAWMGGLSASGGSVEWIRHILAEPQLTYDDIEDMLASLPPGPTGIVYHPYLSGSGAPWPDPHARGSFVGLERRHTRGDVLKAVFEGICMAMELMRQEAGRVTGAPLNDIVVVGGGAKNRQWLQLKADILGCPLQVVDIPEATLVGAGLLAGMQTGLITVADVQAAALACAQRVIAPNPAVHDAYRWIFAEGFIGLQQSLRQYYQKLAGRDYSV